MATSYMQSGRKILNFESWHDERYVNAIQANNLENYLIIFIGAGCIVASMWLMNRCYPLRKKDGALSFNILHPLYFFHILAQVMPAGIFLFDNGYVSAANYWLACGMTALLIPLGGLIVDTIFPTHSAAPDMTSRLAIEKDNQQSWIFGSTLAIIAIAICGLFAIRIESFPLLDLILGNPHSDVMKGRSEINEAGYVFGFARVFIMPLLFAWILLVWKDIKTRPRKIAATALLVMALFYNGYSSAKTPIAMLLVIGATALIIRSKGKLFNKSARGTLISISLLAILTISYPLIIFLLKPFGKENSLMTIITQGIFERILHRPAKNSYATFELFPDQLPFTFFGDIEKLSILTNAPIFKLQHEVSLYKFGEAIAAPPPSVGGFYAEVGWAMVIVGALIAACLFRSIERLLTRKYNNTNIETALYAILVYGAFRFSWAPFHSIFMTETFMPIVLVLCLLWLHKKRSLRISTAAV